MSALRRFCKKTPEQWNLLRREMTAQFRCLDFQVSTQSQTATQRQRLRFGEEEPRNERALAFEKSRSKRYEACSDMAQREGFEPSCSCLQTDFESAPL